MLTKRLGAGFAAPDAVTSAALAADGITGTPAALEGRAGHRPRCQDILHFRKPQPSVIFNMLIINIIFIGLHFAYLTILYWCAGYYALSVTPGVNQFWAWFGGQMFPGSVKSQHTIIF